MTMTVPIFVQCQEEGGRMADVGRFDVGPTAVLVLGGLNLLALGLIGEYLWRILDETRRRPLYQIEDRFGIEPDEHVGVGIIAGDARRSGD